ncbi:hypothetical protein ABT071_36390 [Streptomyces sp. NPDC002506]|uniref:hypothetical protein n=1 Tax=Streptomyces sp. NPDC002506 TaxID=3154536 RepID=UPI00332BB8F2
MAWAVLVGAAGTMIAPFGFGLLFPWRFGVPLVTAVFLTGRRPFAGIRTTGQLPREAQPFVATMYFPWQPEPADALVLLGALAASAAALRRGRDFMDREPTAPGFSRRPG